MCTSNWITAVLHCVPVFLCSCVPSKAVYSLFLNALLECFLYALLECFLYALLECFDHSSSLFGSRVPGGFVLTGSWWEVRRDANSHNLSPRADRLVARKFIQRVLSLHLPYFEVSPLDSGLSNVTMSPVFPTENIGSERESERERV